MRKISAHLILDGRGNQYNKGIVTLDEAGTILNIQDTGGNLQESAEIEFFSGILVPGFVNAHCHLELSHLHQTYPEGTGFVSFLKQVVKNRNNDPGVILAAAEKADWMMHKQGIVAVGDIANGTGAFEVKRNSGIDYYTFIEALGFSPSRAEKSFEWTLECLRVCRRLGLKAGIVPHAPYSVSEPLFHSIAAMALDSDSILSMHSQESEEEDELYCSGGGEMSRHLQENLQIDTSFFSPTGKSAIQSTLGYLPSRNNLLLVHNLFTKQADIDFIKKTRGLDNTWFVLCPGSNLFIHSRLPDLGLFRRNQLGICLGTDSLSSNHQLSILEEMKILQSGFPDLPLDELTTWATNNGAMALRIDDWAGTIEVGKRPGINLLTGVDLVGRRLLPASGVRKLC